MARLVLFSFSLGLAAALPLNLGALKGKNPNPLNGTRVAAVVKDSDAGAPEGPVTVGKIGNLKGTIQYLLCDKYTSGSLSERATNIGAHLARNEDPNSQWFVFLWKASEGYATRNVKGNSYYLTDVCGHDIWVFQREDKYYDRTSCSSLEKDQAEKIIRRAVSYGGSYGAVINRIKQFAASNHPTREFAAFDANFLFTVVGGWNDNWNLGWTGHTSCGRWVDIKKSDTVTWEQDYQVFFFLQ